MVRGSVLPVPLILFDVIEPDGGQSRGSRLTKSNSRSRIRLPRRSAAEVHIRMLTALLQSLTMSDEPSESVRNGIGAFQMVSAIVAEVQEGLRVLGMLRTSECFWGNVYIVSGLSKRYRDLRKGVGTFGKASEPLERHQNL